MIKRILTIVSVFVIIVAGYFIWRGQDTHSFVFAVGDVNINWGVPDGNPIFTVTNMLPGDTESRTVEVINSAAVSRPIAVRGDKLSETLNFATILDFVISENGTDRYGGTSGTGPKTLKNFFDETATPSSIPLSTLGPGNTTHYTFTVTFPSSAGNEFQLASVVFNIVFGIDSNIPAECKDIKFTGPPIFGTAGNDTIHGTLGNDLIFGLEGNDKIFGKLGDDCIVGGTGNDELRGEVGKDVIFGNEGDDLVIGANNEDILFGNEGNDDMRGENGDDFIDAGTGNDTVTGGNGDDEIYGREGNDKISGENGDDRIFGGGGDDTIDGGSGDDYVEAEGGVDSMNGKAGDDTLLGGPGIDSAEGSAGTDTCDAEVETHCEL